MLEEEGRRRQHADELADEKASVERDVQLELARRRKVAQEELERLRRNAEYEFDQQRLQRIQEERNRIEAERIREAERQRHHLYSISDMLNASPSGFESMVMRILARRGYNLVVVGGAGDEGVDLKGTGPNGEVVVVQCKRYQQSKVIGPATVRELSGTMGMQKARVGILVTTSFFSDNARIVASNSPDKLLLVDGTLLVQLAGSRQHLQKWEGGHPTEDLPENLA